MILSFLKEPHRWIEPCYGSLTSFVTGGPEGAARADAAGAAAFGVFCWLEVTGFGFALFFILLCFVLHITF